MNCSICLDDDILEINIHYMECLHYVCDTCFAKLIHNSCPLCRQEISLITKENNYDSDDDEDLLVDDYIFLIRKNRHENRRKKFQKKKDYLHTIIHNEKNIVIPNDKKRIHKKIKRMLLQI